MASSPSVNSPRRRGPSVHIPRPRDGHRAQPESADLPDLAEVAKEAVVSFLRDASAATAERQADRTAAVPPGAQAAPAPAGTGAADGDLAADEGSHRTADPAAAQSVALRAAAMSVATLDRIEAAAAKVEADIATALRAHAELQAGAGAAAETAVSAAQDAWLAAGSAEESDRKAGTKLRLVIRYAAMTTILVVIEFIIFVLFASSAH